MSKARSSSRVSDYSTALPDLEVEPRVMMDTLDSKEQETLRTTSRSGSCWAKAAVFKRVE